MTNWRSLKQQQKSVMIKLISNSLISDTCFYHLIYSDNCLHPYTHNVSAEMSFSRCYMSNSRAFTKHRIEPFMLSSGTDCSNSFNQPDTSIHHHHHVVPLARISLTLSRHFSLLFIASGRSSGLHPVSSYSYCMYVRAGRPAFARPYAEVHWSTLLMSSSVLLQQCPACLVRLTWIVFVMGGRWPCSWCFVGCCHKDLFNIACNILV